MVWHGASGKRVLITGATDGIGLAAAEALAKRGANLAIVARNGAKAERAVERITDAGGPGTSVDLLMADLAARSPYVVSLPRSSSDTRGWTFSSTTRERCT